MATPLHRSSAPQQVSLSDHEKQQLVDFVARHCSASSELTDQQLLALVQRHPLALPTIQPSLEALASNRISHLRIENLPIDCDLPAPPSNGVRPAGKGWQSETTLLQLALACGLQPFGYLEEKAGRLVHEIIPAANRAGELSSSGSVALGWHSDMGILRSVWRPEYLFLIGLRNEALTPTLIAALDDALAVLRQRDASLVEVLRQPRFRIESPASLVWHGGKSLISEARPLVASHLGFDTIAGNLQTLVSTDAQAQQALEAFEEAVTAVSQPIVIGVGEACLFNNARVLHGRPAIQGGPRWLQRVYCRRSLRQLRQATASPNAVIFSISELLLR
jgi:L-asparagine oxygenase